MRMTGITDALHNARAAVGLAAAESPEEICRLIRLPHFSWQQRQALVPHAMKTAVWTSGSNAPSVNEASSVASWALLLPITFSGAGESDECLNMLRRFKNSLLNTTTADDRSGILVCVAIDQGDCIYTEGTVSGVFGGCGLAGVDVTLVHPGFFGNVCSIWNLLGAKAVRDFNVSFLVLLGDDVELETAGWKTEIEVAMRDFSAGAGLPEGLACVAFRDLTMPAFPSFPVINRRHVEIFGNLLPPEFVNQGGDPFLFELYRRWGASGFAPTAALKNLVGGKSTARYPKVGVCWQDAILQREIDRFWKLVQPTGPRVRCMGVVVPTF